MKTQSTEQKASRFYSNGDVTEFARLFYLKRLELIEANPEKFIDNESLMKTVFEETFGNTDYELGFLRRKIDAKLDQYFKSEVINNTSDESIVLIAKVFEADGHPDDMLDDIEDILVKRHGLLDD